MEAVTAVAGATGLLGGSICRHLAEAGLPVRALVRPTSAPERVGRLEQLGAEVRHGDLKEPASLARFCEGARAVITTATSILSQQQGDSIQTVDLEGTLALIEAARRAGVEHFVYVSFISVPERFPLQDAKRAVEQALTRAALPRYSILRSSFFTEVWLGPAVGFDFMNARARLFGTGAGRTNWLSFEDVARFAVGALRSPHARDAVLEVGGEEALSQRDVVSLFEQWSGRRWTLEAVPEDMLRAQMNAASDARQRSVAAMMLTLAHGCELDPGPAIRALHVRPAPVRDYVRSVLGQQPVSTGEAPAPP
jgi:NADH dehydrogenase